MNLENAVIINDYAYVNGGSAKIAIETALNINKRGINVFFFAAVAPIDDRLQKSDVKIICLDGKDLLHESNKIKASLLNIWNNKAKKELDSLLEQLNPQNTVIHIHGWIKALSSSVLYPINRRGFSVVITTHDYFVVCPNGGLYNYSKRSLCKYTPMSLRCILCNCDKRKYYHKIFRVTRQLIQNIFIKNNGKINYISISELNEKLNKKFTVSQKYTRILNPVKNSVNIFSHSDFPNCIAYVGRISEEKGTDIFCEAVQRLIRQGCKFDACVIGDGDDIGRYKSKYPNVHFLGWMSHEETLSIIRESRVLILPSRCYEGAPLTVIEAMTMGIPCIVSDSTSATEIVNRNTGYVFESENISDLMKCIREALNDNEYNRKKALVENTFDSEIYHEDMYSSCLVNLYNEVLKEKR